jgi:serine/threonine protein kinase
MVLYSLKNFGMISVLYPLPVIFLTVVNGLIFIGLPLCLQVIQLIDESIRRQIAEELKISLSTQCQYVVMFYQCFYFNGAISIVLEYMDGGSLADFLKTVKTIPENYLAAICKQNLIIEIKPFLCRY